MFVKDAKASESSLLAVALMLVVFVILVNVRLRMENKMGSCVERRRRHAEKVSMRPHTTEMPWSPKGGCSATTAVGKAPVGKALIDKALSGGGTAVAVAGNGKVFESCTRLSISNVKMLLWQKRKLAMHDTGTQPLTCTCVRFVKRERSMTGWPRNVVKSEALVNCRCEIGFPVLFSCTR